MQLSPFAASLLVTILKMFEEYIQMKKDALLL